MRAERRRNPDATEEQRPALHQPVQVVAGADRRPVRTGSSGIAVAPRRDPSAVVIFTLSASPSTMCTTWPARSASAASSVASTPDSPSAIASPSTVAAKRLRRLREEDRFARNRLDHRQRSRSRRTRFTVSLDRLTATIAAPCSRRRVDRLSRSDPPSRTAARHRAPARRRCLRVDRPERVGDGVLAAVAAGDRRESSARRRGSRRRRRPPAPAAAPRSRRPRSGWPRKASTLRWTGSSGRQRRAAAWAHRASPSRCGRRRDRSHGDDGRHDIASRDPPLRARPPAVTRSANATTLMPSDARGRESARGWSPGRRPGGPSAGLWP